MALVSPSFRSISKVSIWLVKLSIIGIFASIVLLILQFYESLQFLFTDVMDPILLDIEGDLVIIFSILGIITTSVMLIWFYKASKNIQSFGAKGVTSPIMAVVWWFVPILNFWKPYYLALEIYKASNPRIILSKGNEWKDFSSPKVVKLWWVLGIFFLFAYYIASFYWTFSGGSDYYMYQEQTLDLFSIYEKAFYSNFAYITSNVIGIASTIFFIRMVKQISSWQEIKAGISI